VYKWFTRYSNNRPLRLRIFCFPSAGGSASEFRGWVDYLPKDVELLSLQLPGRENRFNEPMITDFTKLIDVLKTEVIGLLDIPYIFFGHSLGALIAFELLLQLEKDNFGGPKVFIASAKEAPHCHTLPLMQDIINDGWLIGHLKQYASVPESYFDSSEFKEVFFPYIRADFLLLSSYKFRSSSSFPVINAPIVALHGENDATTNIHNIKTWEKHTNKTFSHCTFKGGHFFIRESQKSVLEFISKNII